MLASLIALVLCSQGPGLADYVGRDLRKLPYEEGKRFEARLRSITKEKDGVAEQISRADPYWIKPYRIGQSEWILFRARSPMMIPGASHVQAYLFDRDWRLVRKFGFAAGHRLWIDAVKYEALPWFTQPLISVKVSPEGPGALWQTYAFDERGAYLVRLKGESDLVTGFYIFGIENGPIVSSRTVKEWRSDLFSSDPVHQLSCLTWVSAVYRWGPPGPYFDPSRDQTKTARALCGEKAVVDRIKALQTSQNPWVRDQAKATLSHIAPV